MPFGSDTLDAPGSDPAFLDALERELTSLAGQINAGNYRFLTLLAEFDRRGGYHGAGIVSCAHWLSWRCGIGLIAARDKVRVARALERLPKISDAMRRGVLSYCKVRAITRIATAESEELLLQVAEAGTVSHVEKVVRLYRRAERAQELESANGLYAKRYLQAYVDEDGTVVVKARLAPEQGARFLNALRSASDALRQAERDSREACPPPDAPDDAHHAERADALELLAETFLVHGATPTSGGDRHLIHVHVDAEVLRDDALEGRCTLDEHAAIPPATARRLACDGSLVEHKPLDVGRKSRAVTTAQRRALEDRDQHCRFPGCRNRRFVDTHHIQHWADGGKTDLDNLVLLCRRHHRFVHEHGFTIDAADGGNLRFYAPNGRPIPEVPEPIRIDADIGHDDLCQHHSGAGLDITPDTADSHWDGDDLDYNQVLEALLAANSQDLAPKTSCCSATNQ